MDGYIVGMKQTKKFADSPQMLPLGSGLYAVSGGGTVAGGAHLVASERRLKRGETLFRTGDSAGFVFTVVSGCLKLKREYPAGSYLVGLVGEGETLGLAEALTFSRSTLTATATTAVVVKVTPTSEVLRLRDQWTEQLARATELGDLFRTDDGTPCLKRPLALMPVRARVAATLWTLTRRFGVRASDADGVAVELGLTREEIAHLAGTVYESVIRTFASLKQEGIIDLEGRTIRVLDEDQLARIGQVVVVPTHYENTGI